MGVASVSSRGARGGSVDRGRGRGRGTGVFHAGTLGSIAGGGYQRSTSLYDEENGSRLQNISASGIGRSGSLIERGWPERNGTIERNGISEVNGDWSGNTTLSSPRKDYSRAPLTGSGGGTSVLENWRRGRTEEEVGDGWRNTSSSSRSEKWSGGSSSKPSWRDDENREASIEAQPKKVFQNSITHSSQAPTSIDPVANKLVPSQGYDDDLPEWATEGPNEGGGSFDSSGAFHGSDDEKMILRKMSALKVEEKIIEKEKKETIPEKVVEKQVVLTVLELEEKSPTPTAPDIPDELETSSVDRMQEVADDMVEKLIMDDDHGDVVTPELVNPVSQANMKKSPSSNFLPSKSNVKLENAIDNTSNILPQMTLPTQQPTPPAPQVSSIVSDLWYYHDPQGNVQGPFNAAEMAEWYRAGYFDENLYVRRQCDTRYSTLGDLVEICGGIPFLASHLIPPMLGHSMIVPPEQQKPLQSKNMTDFNYFFQKNYYIRHQQMVIQKLSQYEHWSILSPEQQSALVNQHMAQMGITPPQLTQPKPPPPPQLPIIKPNHFEFGGVSEQIPPYLLAPAQQQQQQQQQQSVQSMQMASENDPIKSLMMQLSMQKTGNVDLSWQQAQQQNRMPVPAQTQWNNLVPPLSMWGDRLPQAVAPNTSSVLSSMQVPNNDPSVISVQQLLNSNQENIIMRTEKQIIEEQLKLKALEIEQQNELRERELAKQRHREREQMKEKEKLTKTGPSIISMPSVTEVEENINKNNILKKKKEEERFRNLNNNSSTQNNIQNSPPSKEKLIVKESDSNSNVVKKKEPKLLANQKVDDGFILEQKGKKSKKQPTQPIIDEPIIVKKEEKPVVEQKRVLKKYANNNTNSSNTNNSSITSTPAPWSASAIPGLTTPSLSLAEIQKIEMERRAEQQKTEQSIREHQQILTQEIQKEQQLIWNGRNVLPPKNIKSLTEIQAEEHAKHIQKSNNDLSTGSNNALSSKKSSVNNNAPYNNVENEKHSSFTSIWNNTSQNLSWTSPTVATSNSKVWNQNNSSNVVTNSGFWEEPVKTTISPKSNVLQTSSPKQLAKSHTMSNIQTTKVKSKEPLQSTINKAIISGSNKVANTSKSSSTIKTASTSSVVPNKKINNDDTNNEFIIWCIKALSNITNTVDGECKMFYSSLFIGFNID